MAKYVVNSRLSFARNFILAENNRSRSSPLLQAAKRYPRFEQKLSKRKIIEIHLMSFILMTVILFLSSEPLLKKFASGIHDVGMWLSLITYGTIGILILTIVSCLIFIKLSK
ncbi:hypothetical protein FLAN108750_13990 [Flavobacterium antarcticum]